MVIKRIGTFKTIFTNALFQYTIISLIVTFSVTIFLQNELKRLSMEHAVTMHSSYYLNLANSFTGTYPDLAKYLRNNTFLDQAAIDELEHLKEDSQFFPNLTRIALYSQNGTSVWTNEVGLDVALTDSSERISQSLVGEFNFHISQMDNQVFLHLFIPIIHEDTTIGVIGLTDYDAGFLEITTRNQRVISNYMIIGGISFYLLLFFLFLNIYIKQSRNLKRSKESQNLTILSMSSLAELRDNDTGAHIVRTKKYCAILATQLHKSKRYKKYISRKYITDLEQAAPLHDIGKVGIPDNILLKPGKLTDVEFEVIKQHPSLGAKVLQDAISTVSFKSYFDIAIQLVKHHHENWDGTGYPEGLAGEAIPLSARIMAIADVYDALTTERVYKRAYSHGETIEIMKAEAGRKFDPILIENFLMMVDDFKEISSINWEVEVS